MNKEDRITYEEFIIAFKNAPKLAYILYDKAEDEIERLNNKIEQLQTELNSKDNIINELEKYLKENIKLTKTAVHFEILDDYDTRKYKRDIALFEMVLDKLKELKENNK